MVVRIRLARFGNKHNPFFNIVVAQARYVVGQPFSRVCNAFSIGKSARTVLLMIPSALRKSSRIWQQAQPLLQHRCCASPVCGHFPVNGYPRYALQQSVLVESGQPFSRVCNAFSIGKSARAVLLMIPSAPTSLLRKPGMWSFPREWIPPIRPPTPNTGVARLVNRRLKHSLAWQLQCLALEGVSGVSIHGEMTTYRIKRTALALFPIEKALHTRENGCPDSTSTLWQQAQPLLPRRSGRIIDPFIPNMD
jgi:hypothetical protein